MTLKIFLDDKSFHCRKQSIPAASRSKLIIQKAVHMDLFGSNAVVSCNEAEARKFVAVCRSLPGGCSLRYMRHFALQGFVLNNLNKCSLMKGH